MRFILLFITNLFFLGSFAQDESKWRAPADRDINFPAEEYWRHFEKFEYGNKIKDGKLKKKERQALTQAKGQLSKKIYTSVSSESNRDVIRKEEIYNSMFSSSTDEKSNVTFTDLKEEIIWEDKNRTCIVFLYVKRSDLQSYWLNSYNYLIQTTKGKIESCSNIFYEVKNYQKALKEAEKLEKEVERIDALGSLLSSFTSNIKKSSVVGDFRLLMAAIEQKIEDDQNYSKNKDNGEINMLSEDILNLEVSLGYFEQAKKIDPSQAISDEIPSKINIVKNKLFELYCREGLNSEELNQYKVAIDFYLKAKNINNNKNIPGKKETPTQKIKESQDKLIDILESKGLNELSDNPYRALEIFKEQQRMIDKMQRIDKIKRVNKLIAKTNRKIRRQKIRDKRDDSSRRILLVLGGGFQTDYSNYENIYSEQIDFSVKNWNINTTLGYRMNLPEKGERSKSGREKSKGNVVALFFKKGNTNLAPNFTSDFTEVEFGYISREWLRLSAGIGNRIISEEYKNEFPQTLENYYTATGMITFHFGRLSTDIGVTYLFDNEFEPKNAKLNANIGLRFYFLKKIYSEDKKKI